MIYLIEKFIPQDNTSMTNYTLEYYAKFGRDKFLELREQFLDYKMKKDLKDKLESKLPEKQIKIGVKKICSTNNHRNVNFNRFINSWLPLHKGILNAFILGLIMYFTYDYVLLNDDADINKEQFW